MTENANSIVPIEQVQQCIYLIRRHKVIFDADLAKLYGVQTKVLVRSIKRNIERFPCDFMFQLTEAEHKGFLRCQFGTSKDGRGGEKEKHETRNPKQISITKTQNSKLTTEKQTQD